MFRSILVVALFAIGAICAESGNEGRYRIVQIRDYPMMLLDADSGRVWGIGKNERGGWLITAIPFFDSTGAFYSAAPAVDRRKMNENKAVYISPVSVEAKR